jgi:hypothetical protein
LQPVSSSSPAIAANLADAKIRDTIFARSQGTSLSKLHLSLPLRYGEARLLRQIRQNGTYSLHPKMLPPDITDAEVKAYRTTHRC